MAGLGVSARGNSRGESKYLSRIRPRRSAPAAASLLPAESAKAYRGEAASYSMNATPNNALQRTPPASPLAPLSFQTFGARE